MKTKVTCRLILTESQCILENRKERETDERYVSMMIHVDMTKITLNHTSASRSDYYSFRYSVCGNRREQMGPATVNQIVVLNSLSLYFGPRIVAMIRGSEWEGTGQT